MIAAFSIFSQYKFARQRRALDMLQGVKRYTWGLVALVVAMIVAMVTLNQLKRVPVVGKVAGAAQDLMQDGQLS
jgi:hypothetical protein